MEWGPENRLRGHTGHVLVFVGLWSLALLLYVAKTAALDNKGMGMAVFKLDLIYKHRWWAAWLGGPSLLTLALGCEDFFPEGIKFTRA